MRSTAKLLSLLLLISVESVVAQEQELQILALEPAPSQTGVDLETTVTFTFSMPLDTTAQFDGQGPLAFYAIEPADSIIVHSSHISEDRTAVSFEVSHRPETDYVWVLTGARSEQGTLLCDLTSLSYTTGQERGSAIVRGEVAVVVSKADYSTPSSSCTHLPWLAALLDGPPDSSASIVAAAAIDDSERFEITGVRSGTYWPVLLLDDNLDGLIRPQWSGEGFFHSEVGLYDPDFDSRSDSLEVGPESMEEIELSVGPTLAIEAAEVPGRARLLQNYPNPFRGSTMLSFELEQPLAIRLVVYDLLGRRVAEAARGMYTRGRHEVSWSASALSAGLYVVRLEGPDFTLVRRLIHY